MIPRVHARTSRPATPLSILLLIALLVAGACNLGASATATPGPTAAAPTPCPGTTADPNATPWNGGTAAPGTTNAPCPTVGPSPGATTAAGSPGASGAPGDSAAPSASAEPTPTPRPSSAFIVHVVAAGDNLTSIARTYDTHPRSIAFWNRDAYPSLDPDSPTYRPNYLEVGWKLRLIPGVTLTDPLPTRRPSARPSVSIPPPPSVAPGEPAAIISNGPRGTNHIALTFDMGGELDPALDIIAFLIENDVRATIFPTGQAASEEEIGIEVLELIASKPDLFLVGNHSYDHPNFTELSPEQIADQLDRTEQVIVEATGRSSQPFFRPPFGAQNAAVRQAIADVGWPYLVMWDIDTIDWKPTSDGGPTTDDIVAKVLTRAEGGSIVLMHLGGFHTLEALPRILEGLRDKGLEPVTLSEMLGL